jgi:hypothetical protein
VVVLARRPDSPRSSLASRRRPQPADAARLVWEALGTFSTESDRLVTEALEAPLKASMTGHQAR